MKHWTTALALCAGLASAAQAQEATLYSQANGWTVTQLRENGQIVACEAMLITGPEQGLFYRYDTANSVIGFSGPASAASPFPIDVDMWFDDGVKAYQSYIMQPITDHNGYEWRGLVMTNDEPWGELDQFQNAATLHVGYDTGHGVAQFAFPLSGSNRAVADTIACAQPAPQPAVVQAAPQVIYGSCKLIVHGQIYVDMAAGCPIWLANDGSGNFWINTDRTAYLGQYFAEIAPDGTGQASGWWNAEPGATHAQAPLGDGFRMGNGGCWSNATATVCAAR
jgi:hypothetical protein